MLRIINLENKHCAGLSIGIAPNHINSNIILVILVKVLVGIQGTKATNGLRVDLDIENDLGTNFKLMILSKLM